MTEITGYELALKKCLSGEKVVVKGFQFAHDLLDEVRTKNSGELLIQVPPQAVICLILER